MVTTSTASKGFRDASSNPIICIGGKIWSWTKRVGPFEKNVHALGSLLDDSREGNVKLVTFRAPSYSRRLNLGRIALRILKSLFLARFLNRLQRRRRRRRRKFSLKRGESRPEEDQESFFARIKKPRPSFLLIFREWFQLKTSPAKKTGDKILVRN